jgi:hypothetical protein
MLPLLEAQATMRRALLTGDSAGLIPLIASATASAEAQIEIYRNNVFASLTRVLRDTFPVVCRLVDERFFAYAAHEFISEYPPQRPCLTEYGGGFADFLAEFPPCRHLPYLADVARFEWLLSVAANAVDTVPLAPSAIASLPPEATPRLMLTLDPALGFLESPWPIDRIWQTNQPGADTDEVIDLDAGGVHLEVNRRRDNVIYRSLGVSVFTFRQALGKGATLEAATARAFAVNGAFDLAAAVADLFREGAVTGFVLAEAAGA